MLALPLVLTRVQVGRDPRVRMRARVRVSALARDGA
jgi:hypothetical protein